MSIRKKKRELPPDDDGRVIASMNVEGMPWFNDAPAGYKKPSERDGGLSRPTKQVSDESELLSGKDARRATFAAVGASLLIVGVFVVAFALFILFCTKVWFK